MPHYRTIIDPFLYTVDGTRTCRWDPALAGLLEVPWRFTEKVDGWPVRVDWDGEGLRLGPRAGDRRLPTPAREQLRWALDWDRARQALTDLVPGPVTLHGLLYGAGMRHGHRYRPDVAFLLLDAEHDGAFLPPGRLDELAAHLGLDTAPVVLDHVTLPAAVDEVRRGLLSRYGGFLADGLIGTCGTLNAANAGAAGETVTVRLLTSELIEDLLPAEGRREGPDPWWVAHERFVGNRDRLDPYEPNMVEVYASPQQAAEHLEWVADIHGRDGCCCCLEADGRWPPGLPHWGHRITDDAEIDPADWPLPGGGHATRAMVADLFDRIIDALDNPPPPGTWP